MMATLAMSQRYPWSLLPLHAPHAPAWIQKCLHSLRQFFFNMCIIMNRMVIESINPAPQRHIWLRPLPLGLPLCVQKDLMFRMNSHSSMPLNDMLNKLLSIISCKSYRADSIHMHSPPALQRPSPPASEAGRRDHRFAAKSVPKVTLVCQDRR
jgi:hypothetical protein